MMHLHLKTCPATTTSKGPCPTHYHGCDQARKLLAHYRQCKTARSSSSSLQHGTLPASRRSGSFDSQPAAHCLICSFVARQARTLLERGGGGGTGSPAGNGGRAAAFGSLGSSSWHSRKHPPPSKAGHTVSFVVNVVADAVSALASDDAPPARTTASPALAKSGSPPVNGILKLQPPFQALLPPPPPPPPPPSPCVDATTGPSEQATRARSDDDAGDVVMSAADDSTRSEVTSSLASTKAVLVPDSKTPTSSPPDPTFLTAPDAASLLCSLACNLHRPLKVLPESYSSLSGRDALMQQRRDRAVSSADSLLTTTGHPYQHISTRREPLTLDVPQPLGLVRRRSVSLGSAPPTYGPRTAASSGSRLRVDDTIYEEGSQTSGDSIEPLDFPTF
jgi:hypothetical protein